MVHLISYVHLIYTFCILTARVFFLNRKGELVIDHLVKRKKHVALFITVPGKFESMNVTMPLQKQTDGMGLSGNHTADLGFAVSEEAIIASLAKKSGIAKFCEANCQ